MKGLAVSDKLDKNFCVKIIRKIKEDEYNHINEIIATMEKIEFIYSAKVPLVENYNEIMTLIDDYKNNKISPMTFKYYIVVRIQNFLSSIRGYIDTFAHTLSSEYGKESKVFHKFKKLKNAMYEAQFSYRFIEELRNYAQHRALPISSLQGSFENNEKIMKLIIKKQELLSDYKIKVKKKEDIESNCPDEIDLVPHLTNMFGFLMIIHDEMVASIIDNNKCDEFFRLEKEFEGEAGIPLLLDFEKLDDKKEANFYPRWLKFHTLRDIISQLNNNLILFNLNSCIANANEMNT